MRKKTVVIHTDWSKLKTGFSKHKRAILRYLFNTGKYKIIESVNGLPFDHPELKTMPWPAYGALASPEKQNEINSIQDQGQREHHSRLNSYGAFGMDKIVKETGADILVVAQDSWGADFFPDAPWAKKITYVPHITIDSKNLMPAQIDLAAKVDKLYLWASFGVKMYEELGYKNVEHLYGCIETDKFFPIEDTQRNELRKRFGLENCLVGVNTFRNQTRKSIPNLLDGFKLYKIQYPDSKIKLIFVTSLQEGWDIPRLIQERGIDFNDILFTYYCKSCQKWEIRPFSGHDQECPICGAKNTFNTVNITHGISDEDLNLVYNCADFGLGVFNSGGAEIPPAIEMKLAGLPVLATSYSCGEDITAEGRGALPLDYAITYEFGTLFQKASTLPSSISQRFKQLNNLSREERIAFGQEGRRYVLENITPEVIGKRLEEIFDAAPFVDWQDSDFVHPPKNPSHIPPDNLSPEDFVVNLMTQMMHDKADKNTSHVKNWAAHLRKSNDYKGVYKHFQNLAAQFNANLNNKPIDLAELLDKNDNGKRIAIVAEQSAGDILILNSLLKQFKDLYPEYNLYFFTRPEFFDIVEGHESIHKILPYSPIMENIFFMEGRGSNSGYFKAAFYPFAQSQKHLSYQHNDLKHRAEWLG